ncbi:MAG: twitch domain-containing radical SAM protein [Bacteriovoracaceae bacterium]|nr:twitch domain-containing radical SAM protein [Bacteriovoracaceae bacterium]
MSKQFICPLPWLHLSVAPDGTQRVCCHADKNHLIIDGNKTVSFFDKESKKSISNNSFYKHLRTQMLNGEVPKACETCFKQESIGGYSPRLDYLESYPDVEFKSNSSLDIKSLDLCLGNKCNLECRMCSPLFSNRLSKTFDTLNINYNKKSSQLAESLWNSKEFPWEVMNDLTELELIYFQGGEPLISNLHKEILKKLIATGKASSISLEYSTNLTVLNSELIELWSHFKHVQLFVSIDGVGKFAEYIRYPLRWDEFENNLKSLIGTKLSINFATTLQAYNYKHIPDLLLYLNNFKDHFGVIPEPTHVQYPNFLSVNALPQPEIDKSTEEIIKVLDSLTPTTKRCHKNLKSFHSSLKNIKTDKNLYIPFTAYTRKLDVIRSESFDSLAD